MSRNYSRFLNHFNSLFSFLQCAHKRPEIMWQGERTHWCTFVRENIKKEQKKMKTQTECHGKKENNNVLVDRKIFRCKSKKSMEPKGDCFSAPLSCSTRCPSLVSSTCIIVISFANQAQTIFLCNCFKIYIQTKNIYKKQNKNYHHKSWPVSI